MLHSLPQLHHHHLKKTEIAPNSFIGRMLSSSLENRENGNARSVTLSIKPIHLQQSVWPVNPLSQEEPHTLHLLRKVSQVSTNPNPQQQQEEEEESILLSGLISSSLENGNASCVDLVNPFHFY